MPVIFYLRVFSPVRMEKATRSNLTPKIIKDKNGKITTVYVSPVKNEPWYKHQLTQKQLKLFIKEARTGKSNKKAFIGTVTPNASQRIEAVCNIKVRNIMLESGSVRHSFNKVSHKLKNDDLLHIVDAVNTATDIKVSNKSHQNNKCLKISKNINGKITFVMEVRVHYGGWLSLVTCYRL